MTMQTANCELPVWPSASALLVIPAQAGIQVARNVRPRRRMLDSRLHGNNGARRLSARLAMTAVLMFLPALAVAENVNGAGASLNLATTDLASSSAQTSGAGGRLLWASTPGRGVVSVNGAGAKGIIEPLHVHGVSGMFAVDFSGSPQTGDAPLEVQFTDLSTSGVYTFESWSWDFGDGSPPDSSRNPLHVYENPGVYTVTLTVTTDNGSASKTKADYIAVENSLPASGPASLALLAAALALAGVPALRRVSGNKRGRPERA